MKEAQDLQNSVNRITTGDDMIFRQNLSEQEMKIFDTDPHTVKPGDSE